MLNWLSLNDRHNRKNLLFAVIVNLDGTKITTIIHKKKQHEFGPF